MKSKYSTSSFKIYKSKPSTRLAHEIKESDTIEDGSSENRYRLTTKYGTFFEFSSYGEVNIGDFIVFINEHYVCHCSREIFMMNNVVEGEGRGYQHGQENNQHKDNQNDKYY